VLRGALGLAGTPQEAASVHFQLAQLDLSRNCYSAAMQHAMRCVSEAAPCELRANAFALWGLCALKTRPHDPEVQVPPSRPYPNLAGRRAGGCCCGGRRLAARAICFSRCV